MIQFIEHKKWPKGELKWMKCLYSGVHQHIKCQITKTQLSNSNCMVLVTYNIGQVNVELLYILPPLPLPLPLPALRPLERDLFV